MKFYLGTFRLAGCHCYIYTYIYAIYNTGTKLTEKYLYLCPKHLIYKEKYKAIDKIKNCKKEIEPLRIRIIALLSQVQCSNHSYIKLTFPMQNLSLYLAS